ncbi:MAG: hypothetical protein V1754_14160, partial [Pseudomonadota bacterium]
MTRTARIFVGGGILLILSSLAVAKGDVFFSSVLYPRGEEIINFSHKTHEDTSCVECHAEMKKSVSPGDQYLPRESRCRSCHAEDTRETNLPIRKPGEKRCSLCHVGYKGEGSPPQRVREKERLRFSHRLHSAKEVSCEVCHQPKGGEMGKPPMSSCLACHREKKATNRCVVCHLSSKDGRLETRFGNERLKPSGSPKGDAHNALFARRHTQVARANQQYCEKCHTQNDCLRCHAGSFKPNKFHQSDYVTHHVLDARKNDPNCSSCHRSQTFCISCHLQTGTAQSSKQGGFKPNTGTRFHPPGFTDKQVGPKHHSYSARRNVATCSSCHTEKNCIQCHGSRLTGRGGINPHPKDFGKSLKCRMLSKRNHRACLKCHPMESKRLKCE